MSKEAPGIRESLRQFWMLVLTAVFAGFLLNVLASLLAGDAVLSSLRSFVGAPEFILVPALAGLLCGLIFAYYRSYVVAPHARPARSMTVQILFNKATGEVIDDPFDGYHAQKMGWQAFRRFLELHPEARDALKKSSAAGDERRILTELLEYACAFQMAEASQRATLGHRGRGRGVELRLSANGNRFLREFDRRDAQGLTDLTLANVALLLPVSMKIEVSRNVDAFAWRLRSGRSQVRVQASMTSLMPVQSMVMGPAPEFEGVYIRSYFQERLKEQLGALWRATFTVSVAGDLRLRWGLFAPTTLSEWTEQLSEYFARGALFGPLDIAVVRERQTERMQRDMYETIRRLEKLVERE